MAKRGRKHKGYVASDGSIIPGLWRDTNGRWRVIATGHRFTESSEYLAIERYKALSPDRESIFISVSRSSSPADTAVEADKLPADSSDLSVIEHDDDSTEIGYKLDSQATWAWFRHQLINQPIYVAKMTGIPQLASFASLDMPKEPVRVDQIRQAYRKHSHATDLSKRRAVDAFNRLVDFSEAKVLSDITDEKVSAFREMIVTNSNMTSSGTIAQMFSTIRGVLRLSMRGDLDDAQIEATLKRCTKLYAPKNNVESNPHPIDRQHFHDLLDGAHQTKIATTWRAMLMMALNAALYMEDICDLKWEHIDLEKQTFLARRKKRGQCIRAAVLWDETVDALKAIKRAGSPFVFVSPTGTRYSKNTKINDFADLRTKAKVPSTVTWSHIRDGAFTVAMHGREVEAKYAKLLNGHASGMDDKYVLRNPECVRPATDAVYRVYFG